MPPRSPLTSSFSVSEENDEVVCPLKNNDGSNCRKRCLGEKRYRSMQEHIRRAHPSHYIPKLPATEDSFLLMVSTSSYDHHRNLSPSDSSNSNSRRENDYYFADASSPPPPATRPMDESQPAAATAAVALAQLHHHRLTSDWDTDMETHSDHDFGRDRMQTSIELPPLRDHFKQDSLPPLVPSSSPNSRDILPPILNHSPPPRSATLPPIQQRDKVSRSRKSSISNNGPRKLKHDRFRHRDHPRRPSLDRKAMSAEPQTAAWAQGKRWEDLIEAATSATEADDDRYSETGPSPTLPSLLSNITSAPSTAQTRFSLPPAFSSGSSGLPIPPSSSHHRPFQQQQQQQHHSYAASPLHKSLTPPPYEVHRGGGGGRDSDPEPFPSIESSLESASTTSVKNFPLSTSSRLKSDSSPVQNSLAPPSNSLSERQNHRFSNPTPSSFCNHNDVQIYCSNCRRPWPLNDCYACTECISGLCRECVGLFINNSPPASFVAVNSSPLNNIGIPGKGNNAIPHGPTSYPSPRACPRCRTVNGQWKPFQLEFR